MTESLPPHLSCFSLHPNLDLFLQAVSCLFLLYWLQLAQVPFPLIALHYPCTLWLADFSKSENCIAPADNCPRPRPCPRYPRLGRTVETSAGLSVSKLKINCSRQCHSQEKKHVPRGALWFIFNLRIKKEVSYLNTQSHLFFLQSHLSISRQ
jgi:hypothetical protein